MSAGSGLGRQLVIALVIGVLVVAGLSFYGDVGELKAHLGSYRWGYFAGGLALATANYALRFLRWELYLRVLDVRDVPRLESARIFVAGFVMSVTPGKVGEVFKSVLLQESHGVPIAHTAPIVVAERLTDLLALVLLAAAGSLALSEGPAAAVGGGIIVAILWATCAWQPLGEFALRCLDRIPGLRKLTPAFRKAYASLRRLVAPKVFGLATLLSIASWFTECVALWVIVRGFPGATIGWLEATFAYAAPTIVGAVAMLPGGLGVTEASMTAVLERLGPMGAPIATGITLLVRLATLWWAVFLGVLALAWQRRAQSAHPLQA